MKRGILKHTLVFLFLLFCHSSELHALGDLNYSIKFCEDNGHNFSLSDIMKKSCHFKSANTLPISLGYSTSHFWFKIQPDTARLKVQFLEIRYPLDSIKVYIPTIDGGFENQTSGEILTFSDRFIRYRNHLFDLSQYDFQNPIYVQIKSDTAIQLPISFWTSRNLLEKINVEQYILGLYFGFILVMFFYNGFLAVSLRDKSYMYGMRP